MSDMQTRQHLLASAERHEEELERALGDLGRAIRRPFEAGEHLREHIGNHPLPYLFASLLVGLWLGSRSGGK